jgi:hypothetical protein
MCVASRAMEDRPIVVQVGAMGTTDLGNGEEQRELCHIDLHADCSAGVCIIHGEPKSNEERRWGVWQNRVAHTFCGKSGLRERGRLWTPRVKYMFGQHLHSVEYLMLPFSSAVEGVSALILKRV